MRFTVIWLPLALNELADIWTSASNRAVITVASHHIDQRLSTDPLDEGESRDALNARIVFESPLRVLYRVFPDRNEVHVYSVSEFTRKA